jgi:transcriptional regulator with XRE-family HTH domain
MQQVGKNQNNVRAAIQYGGIKDIAERSNTSIYTVSRVLNGKSKNLKVLKEIDTYLKELLDTNSSIHQIAETLAL